MARTEDPILVTTAPRAPADELRQRQRRYLVTMAIRTACFVLAVVLVGLGLRWEAGIAIAGSLILPWVAVVFANAGPVRTAEQPSLYGGDRRSIER